MTARLLVSTFLFFASIVLSAQVKLTGSVELMDASEDNTQVLFQVDGIAAKKGDVVLSARETVFSRLFHEGVEGVNDDNPMVTRPKNYYVEHFFEGKNAAMNRFVVLEELKGAINKNEEGFYVGTYEVTLNLKALLSALKNAGATDVPVVRAAPPKKGPIGIGAGKKEQEQAAARAAAAAAAAQEQAQAKTLSTSARSAESAQSKALITKDGVGPVRVGQNYTIKGVLNRSTLPDRYADLYDEINCDRNQFDGSFEIVCCLQNKSSCLVFCDDDDKVESFTVLTDCAKTKEGLSTSSSAAEIFAAGGKVQKMPMKENSKIVGYEYRIVLDGVFFLFEQSDVAGDTIKAAATPYAISNSLYGRMD